VYLLTIFRMTFSNSLAVVDKRLIELKLCGNFGSLPGFGNVITSASYQGFGKWDSRMQWLNKCVRRTNGLLGICSAVCFRVQNSGTKFRPQWQCGTEKQTLPHGIVASDPVMQPFWVFCSSVSCNKQTTSVQGYVVTVLSRVPTRCSYRKQIQVSPTCAPWELCLVTRFHLTAPYTFSLELKTFNFSRIVFQCNGSLYLQLQRYVFGKFSVQISARTPSILTDLLWLSALPAGKCKKSSLIGLWSRASKFYTIHYSPIILAFGIILWGTDISNKFLFIEVQHGRGVEILEA
jgi:hypothetical protein